MKNEKDSRKRKSDVSESGRKKPSKKSFDAESEREHTKGKRIARSSDRSGRYSERKREFGKSNNDRFGKEEKRFSYFKKSFGEDQDKRSERRKPRTGGSEERRKHPPRLSKIREGEKIYETSRLGKPVLRKIENPKKSRRKKVGKNVPAKPKDDNTIRLNRYIANAGICSRRDADLLIEAGEISVNGTVVTEMGFKVKPGDTVKYGNRVVNREKPVYVLMNKPKGYITTLDDPEERKIVTDLLKNEIKERIYPVGRLDRNTTGILLLTNDGELAEKLSHPSNEVKKVYQVLLDKPITKKDLEEIVKGIKLEDGFAVADEAAVVSDDNKTVGIEIHIGKYRVVRRMFEHLGYEVLKLDRVMYAGLTKKDLPRGKWRFLTEKEVVQLKYFT